MEEMSKITDWFDLFDGRSVTAEEHSGRGRSIAYCIYPYIQWKRANKWTEKFCFNLQFGEEKSTSKLKVTVKADTKKRLSLFKGNKSLTLHWGSMKGALRTRSYHQRLQLMKMWSCLRGERHLNWEWSQNNHLRKWFPRVSREGTHWLMPHKDIRGSGSI